jgi:hypothetical protein
MKQFKLGFGPMSNEIIEILSSYANDEEYPIMIIASRNQVDYENAYVCTSAELAEKVKPYKNKNLLLCRDHCGPYFADADRGLSVQDAIARCKQTIKADIEAGFDLIHIDVSRIEENQLDYGKELIDYTLSLNPNIKLEFGSEDNTGIDVDSSLGRLEPQLEFLQQYRDNVVFFVTQTGSLTKDSQAGAFDVERNKQVGEQIRAAGFLFKEHNGDYFNETDIANRIAAGIDSINIAPQLGKLQTDITKTFASADVWKKFSDYVYGQNKWQRWVEPGVTDQDIAVSVSGHYCFNSQEYKDVLAAIDYEAFKDTLQSKMVELLDFYQTFDHEHDDVKFKQLLKKRLAELRERDPFIYR